MADLSALPADQLAEKVTDISQGETRAVLAELVRRLKTAEDALEQADDLMRRLSEWDAFSLPAKAPWGDWHVYWKGEVERVRALAAIRPNPDACAQAGRHVCGPGEVDD